MPLVLDVAVPVFQGHLYTLPKRLLARLIAADARYRQAQRLHDMPDESLRDMGIRRTDLRHTSQVAPPGSLLW